MTTPNGGIGTTTTNTTRNRQQTNNSNKLQNYFYLIIVVSVVIFLQSLSVVQHQEAGQRGKQSYLLDNDRRRANHEHRKKDRRSTSARQQQSPRDRTSSTSSSSAAAAAAAEEEEEEEEASSSIIEQYLLTKYNQTFLPLVAYVQDPPLLSSSSASSSAARATPSTNITNNSTILRSYRYDRPAVCVDIQNYLPTGHSYEADDRFGPVVGNQIRSLVPQRYEYASAGCSPVDADPFLPNLHDVFVTKTTSTTDSSKTPATGQDKQSHSQGQGYRVEFVAHNKRRCRTSPQFATTDLVQLEPQVTIMQSVSIKRGTKRRRPRSSSRSRSRENDARDADATLSSLLYQYELTSIDDADPDKRETRFICQFHALNAVVDNAKNKVHVHRDIIDETLSQFPYNYEEINYRKQHARPMLTFDGASNPKDKNNLAHNEQVWNTILQFSCPLSDVVVERFLNATADDDDNQQIYVDVIPIRTRPRYSLEGYNPYTWAKNVTAFDPAKEWVADDSTTNIGQLNSGMDVVGRWANIPLCSMNEIDSGSRANSGDGHQQHVKKAMTTDARPQEQQRRNEQELQNDATMHKGSGSVHNNKPENNSSNEKKHYLVGCTWASAVYATRGVNVEYDASSARRLVEWLAYHLYIAQFDHIFVYDNTHAHDKSQSLKPVIELFPVDRVTHVPWRHRVCNNNRPMHANPGERSSQYAAETSCRARYGPSTRWMVSSFDLDEYMIPQHPWSSIQDWLRASETSGKISDQTHILSLFQTRPHPLLSQMEPYLDHKSTDCRSLDQHCLVKNATASFLKTYDCEPTPLPKPAAYAWRAQKQIYQPDFVLNHYIHYTMLTQNAFRLKDRKLLQFKERPPFERRVDELEEAFMLHTKTIPPKQTVGWEKKCRQPPDAKSHDVCPIGIPWPFGKVVDNLDQYDTTTSQQDPVSGMHYNCFPHQRIQHDLAPQLDQLMRPIMEHYDAYLESVTR